MKHYTVNTKNTIKRKKFNQIKFGDLYDSSWHISCTNFSSRSSIKPQLSWSIILQSKTKCNRTFKNGTFNSSIDCFISKTFGPTSKFYRRAKVKSSNQTKRHSKQKKSWQEEMKSHGQMTSLKDTVLPLFCHSNDKRWHMSWIYVP